MTSSLHQLIYISRLTRRMSTSDLRKLVYQSQVNNSALGVTGALLVHGNAAMQLLEGDRDVVLKLFETIRKDTRHAEVEIMLSKSVSRRLYPEWGMGLVDLSSPLELDRTRMARMISDIRCAGDTKSYSIEARVLLRDFENQAELAA